VPATSRLNAFLHAASERFKRSDTGIGGTISKALGTTHTGPPALPPATTLACDGLIELLSGSKDELLVLLANCAQDLHWRQAGFGRLPGEAQQKLAVAELIGPNALFPMPDVRVGLLIQNEGFHYPRHWHAAEELYLILRGTALWAVADTEPMPREPGSFVHHQSMQPHWMVTNQEPMIALWGWTGDIDGSSYSI
jgi:dimethylpropiothetin dethiomethylase